MHIRTTLPALFTKKESPPCSERVREGRECVERENEREREREDERRIEG